jgi:protocatechuate 3,4-dioxygenase, alpha subunit
MSGITPSATVGPFFLFGLVPSTAGGTDLITNRLATPDAEGQRIRIEGRVLDGDGAPMPDAMVEIWQADAAGRFAHANAQEQRANAAFKGFGRMPTDTDGSYWFETVKPGRVPGPEGRAQAPHILVNLFARGMTRHATTRIYFSDDAANADDFVLSLVPSERRDTLIARREDRNGQPVYRFDIHLQGEHETVFFEA